MTRVLLTHLHPVHHLRPVRLHVERVLWERSLSYGEQAGHGRQTRHAVASQLVLQLVLTVVGLHVRRLQRRTQSQHQVLHFQCLPQWAK